MYHGPTNPASDDLVIPYSRGYAWTALGFVAIYLFVIAPVMVYLYHLGEVGAKGLVVALGVLFIFPFFLREAVKPLLCHVHLLVGKDAFQEREGDKVIARIPYANLRAAYPAPGEEQIKIGFTLVNPADPQTLLPPGRVPPSLAQQGCHYVLVAVGYEQPPDEILTAVQQALAAYRRTSLTTGA